MWTNKAVIFLLPSTVQEQDELLFVTSLLKSHAGQAFDPKDVFSIVDSSAVKKKSSTNVCRWKRIVTGGNLDYSLSDSDLSFSCDNALNTALNEWEEQMRVVRHHPTPGAGGTHTDVAPMIHDLLDTSIMEGVVSTSVYLLWIVPKSGSVRVREVLDVYGCLLRLVEWFSGNVKIFCQDSTVSLAMQEWKDEVFARLYASPSMPSSTYSSTIWSGSIHFPEQKLDHKQSSECVIFSGVNLSADGCEIPPSVAVEFDKLQNDGHTVCHLEVMQVVRRANVPLLWITGQKLNLYVERASCHPDSFELITKVNSWRGSCGLLLSFQTASAANVKSKREHSSWVEFVRNLSDGPVKVPDDYDHRTSMLCYATCPESESAGTGKLPYLELWLLRKPEEVTCPSLQDLASTTCVPRVECRDLKDVEMETLSLVNSLPVISLTSSSPRETADFCSDSSGIFSPFVKTMTPHMSSHVYKPSQFFEVVALRNSEFASHKLKRRLTPDVFKERVVCKTQEDFEDLKASQILDLFNPDGTAVATDGLSSVPAFSNMDHVRHWSLPVGGEGVLARMSHWEASSGSYHGVHYCLDSEASWNARLVRIRQRYIYDDTGGVCAAVTTPKAKEVAKKRNNLRIQKTTHRKTTPNNPNSLQKSVKEISTPPTQATKEERQPFKDIAESSNIVQKSELHVRNPRKRSLSAPLEEENRDKSLVSALSNSTSKLVPKKGKCIQKPNSSPGPATEHLIKSAASEKKSISKEKKSKEKAALKRSARHTKKLEKAVISALVCSGVEKGHPSFKACYKRLFTISKSFLKDLKTSRNLSEEMKTVTKMNAEQVVTFELKRTSAEVPSAGTT